MIVSSLLLVSLCHEVPACLTGKARRTFCNDIEWGKAGKIREDYRLWPLRPAIIGVEVLGLVENMVRMALFGLACQDEGNKLDARVHVACIEDMGHVVFHRVLAEVEGGCYFTVRFSFRHKA